ncbi:alpha/beta fold hydrolase [Streptomyces avermitilis]|uniref:alpha/beta fold hydrolase n=1 Tax=Streptomyces avermitilis TaxID=33903 RepID=UPI0036A51E6A
MGDHDHRRPCRRCLLAPPEDTVVLLHDAGSSARAWDDVLLALDRPAVALDLPGHGRSSRRGRATTAREDWPPRWRRPSAPSRREACLS